MAYGGIIAKLRRLYFRNRNRWVSRLSGSRELYGSVVADGLIFRYNRRDIYIPMLMYGTKEVYSKQDIHFFIEAAAKYYGKRSDSGSVGSGSNSSGGIFLDIGANIGTTSIYVNKRLLPQIKVYAFEPDEQNYTLLKANAELNGCTNFVAEKIALSNSSAKLVMEVNKTNRGGNAVIGELCNGQATQSTTQTDSADNEIVDAITLADYMQQHNISAEQIDYIWIDVEGHEPQVIEGAMPILRQKKIPLFMEFTPALYAKQGTLSALLENLSSIYSHYYAIDGSYGTITALEEHFKSGRIRFLDIFLV